MIRVPLSDTKGEPAQEIKPKPRNDFDLGDGLLNRISWRDPLALATRD